MLPVAPQILDRIQFRSVSRQTLKLQPAVGTGDKLFDQRAPMGRRAIPDHEQVTFDMSHQVFQKNDHLGTPNRARKQLEVEIPPRYASYRRECFPIEVILNNRSLSSRGPRPASMRTLTQSTLINENYSPALSFGVFFNCGHRSFFQRRIISSSRSKARPTGRWQLHPSCRSTHQTCPLEYRIPNSCSMRWPIRGVVHKAVSYPSFSGPAFRIVSICRNWDSLSRDFRPARPAFFSATLPFSASCFAQRLTDCRCTPTLRATSASLYPLPSRRAACIRRFSKASKSRFTPAGFPIDRILTHNRAHVTIISDSQ